MASLCLQASQNRRDSGVDMRVVEVVPVFRPAHRFTGEQIQHHRQKSPAFAGPDVGHIAAPNLVRRGYCELPVEMVRYFNVFVSPRLYLWAGTRQLAISSSFIRLPDSQRPILTPEFLVTIVAMLRAPAEPPLAFQASMTWPRLATRSPSGSLPEACQCL